MTEDIRKAIDRVWKIEHERTSRRWAQVMNEVSAAANQAGRLHSIKTLGDTASAFQQEINTKASRIADGVIKVFAVHRAGPDEADRLGLIRRIEGTLREDEEYAKGMLGGVFGEEGQAAQWLLPVRSFLGNIADQAREVSLHEFDLKLVEAANTSYQAQAHGTIINIDDSPGASIATGSSSIHGGRAIAASGAAASQGNVEITNGEKKKTGWIFTVIGAVIAGLAVLYIWNYWGPK